MKKKRRTFSRVARGLALLFLSFTVAQSSENQEPEILNADVLQKLSSSTRCSFLFRLGELDLAVVKSQWLGDLTPYWAQEMIGADLVPALLENFDHTHPKEKTKSVPVGIFDGGISFKGIPSDRLSPAMKLCKRQPEKCRDRFLDDTHGTSVAQLIVGQDPVGASSRAKISAAASLDVALDYLQGIGAITITERSKDHISYTIINSKLFQDAPVKILSQASRDFFSNTESAPMAVNMSFGYEGGNKEVQEALQKNLSEVSEKTVLVMSAGNAYPAHLSAVQSKVPGIYVGSVTANGLLSEYSQEDEKVVLSAPSGYEIQTISYVEEEDSSKRAVFRRFGGTSGSAPLVTAALADAMSVLGKLSRSEAQVLLAATAQPSLPYSAGISANGAGVLNMYKLVQLALRLKSLGWPQNRSELIERVSSGDSELVDFSALSKKYKLYAQAFLEKASKKNAHHLDCDSQEMLLGLWRKAFLLNTKDVALANALASYYQVNGFSAQSDFYARTELNEMAENFSKSVKQGMAKTAMVTLAHNGFDLNQIPKRLEKLFIQDVANSKSSSSKKELALAQLWVADKSGGASKLLAKVLKNKEFQKNAHNSLYSIIQYFERKLEIKILNAFVVHYLNSLSGLPQIESIRMALFRQKESWSPLDPDLDTFFVDKVLHALKTNGTEERLAAIDSLQIMLELNRTAFDPQSLCISPVVKALFTDDNELVKREAQSALHVCKPN